MLILSIPTMLHLLLLLLLLLLRAVDASSTDLGFATAFAGSLGLLVVPADLR
jgi:hypothetical protein